MELGPGTILAGTYRCERELGEGGMGRVVAATHLVLRQRIALKVLTRTTPTAVQRFLREARLAYRLKSAHVARVLDAGQLDDGVPYIAMELLDGVDLAKLSHDRGPLPVREACSYIVQACAGIAEAHALGMVHRDVKLANLFLAQTPFGSIVKVLDFGCAKAERTHPTSVANATRADAFLGTPRYMAPEQIASSRDVDARADVWSLGVALYTLIAGRPPFDGETLGVLVQQIVKAPAPPIAFALPLGLVDVIERCMRKRPEERFADAGELAIALAPYARAPAQPSKYVGIAFVAIASTIIGASVFFVARHRAPPREASPAPRPIASPSASVAALPAEEAPSTLADVPSSAPSSRVESAALPAPRFEMSYDKAYKDADASDNEMQSAVATMRAGSWCVTAVDSECYAELPECVAEVTKIAFACRTAQSPDACTIARAVKHFARYRVASSTCKLH